MDAKEITRLAQRALKKNTRSSGPRTTGSKELDKLATALWVAEQGKEWFEKARGRYRQRTTWTVTIEETDAAYPVVQQWLLDQLPETQQKNITAVTKTFYLYSSGKEERPRRSSVFDDVYPDDGGSGNKASETRVLISLNESHSQYVRIDGYKVFVQVAPKEVEGDDGRSRSSRARPIRNGKIVFTCRKLEAQQAVINLLNGMMTRRQNRKPSLWVADGWGQWRSAEVPGRKLSSVVLAEGVKEELIGDIQKFLDDEKKYAELGIPWHRGYLFHGPAGTGKTSLIKAIAAEMGLDLWYAPLGDLKEDSSLVDLIRSVRPRGVLLLEDVDAYAAARDRDESGTPAGSGESRGISTSALLNALDGVVTPHGLITIMTTNHLEKLDPALIRSGRADRTIKLDLPGWEEINRMWRLFFPNEFDLDEEPASFPESRVSQASVSEVFKRNWDFPDKARTELMELLDERARSNLS
jgi:chaperone BCS1